MNPKVQINLLNGDTIKLELYPEYAPKSVENFLSLVDGGFYTNVVFHRIIKDFMIQTGELAVDLDKMALSYRADGYTGEKKNVKGEFASNGWTKNTLKHKKGVISMARTNVKDSASQQFFICVADVPHLDGEYAAFGKTLDEDSLNAALKLGNEPTGVFHQTYSDFPLDLVGIASIVRI